MARRGRRNRRRDFQASTEDKEGILYFEGVVEKSLPNTMFLVRADNGMQVLSTIAGKMRRFRIRVLLGDRVTMEVSAYDPTRGRITFRHRERMRA
jgi:translation initiation factor IF-1